jgi:hypothetical protein
MLNPIGLEFYVQGKAFRGRLHRNRSYKGAHEVELSMSLIPINPTLKGFTQCKNHRSLNFFFNNIFNIKITEMALYYLENALCCFQCG